MNIESELYDLEKSKGSVESSKAASSHGKKPKWRAHNQKPKDVFGQSPRDDIAAIPIRRADEATEEVPEDEYHTEELESLKGSEDEEEESKPPEFNEASTFGNVNLELYMLFPNLNVFKEAVRNYTIAQGRPIEFPKNDKVRCRVKCCGEECDWEILCSWAEAYGCYQVKYFNLNHKCSRKLILPQADRQWVAKKLVDILRLTPKMTAADAYAHMAGTYHIQVAEIKLYRALHIAKEFIEGSEKDQYTKLWDYCEELRRNNPGSTLQLGVERPDLSFPARFDKLYICFDATKRRAMRGYKPLIGLDGCFLKGYYGGQLLAAVTQDANHAFYVIAYAIVGQETKETWTFFLTRLFEDIGHPSVHGWEFISDMQKGLKGALHELCPKANHRFCVKHLEAIIWKHWPNTDLRSKVWDCAKSKIMADFERNFAQVKELNVAAWNYLSNLPITSWTRAAFPTESKNQSLLNNMCEQFNGSIVKFRGKPILTMLEDIRTYLMTKINESRNQVAKYQGPITPAAQTKLE
ncbi:uncharacterized protein LOC116203150 [Punica granatum]|uniref:Uncharacterized protein LOC116203150 n=1 Tax=Punica granatum TaxID=22663 RepID=A0A6P8D0Q9_PUNGR|nr:uncharacterized protein LOC116203150 [Punica granatum]